MRKPFPCLWFDGRAEEAASFYTSLLPDSSIDKAGAPPPRRPAGDILLRDATSRCGRRRRGELPSAQNRHAAIVLPTFV